MKVKFYKINQPVITPLFDGKSRPEVLFCAFPWFCTIEFKETVIVCCCNNGCCADSIPTMLIPPPPPPPTPPPLTILIIDGGEDDDDDRDGSSEFNDWILSGDCKVIVEADGKDCGEDEVSFDAATLKQFFFTSNYFNFDYFKIHPFL